MAETPAPQAKTPRRVAKEFQAQGDAYVDALSQMPDAQTELALAVTVAIGWIELEDGTREEEEAWAHIWAHDDQFSMLLCRDPKVAELLGREAAWKYAMCQISNWIRPGLPIPDALRPAARRLWIGQKTEVRRIGGRPFMSYDGSKAERKRLEPVIAYLSGQTVSDGGRTPKNRGDVKKALSPIIKALQSTGREPTQRAVAELLCDKEPAKRGKSADLDSVERKLKRWCRDVLQMSWDEVVRVATVRT